MDKTLTRSDAAEPLNRLRRSGVVPIVEIEDPRSAVPLAQALVEGGLPVVEITFRTAAAAEAIAAIRAEVPEMLVIAGTVTVTEQVAQAVSAGAHLLVAPGLDHAILNAARAAAIPMLPGVCTPSEVQQAHNAGCETVKFFPAEAIGGLPYLKALAGPFRAMGWVPTGGLSPASLPNYLALDSVAACGGSWIAPRATITSGDFDTVRTRAAEASDLVASCRVVATVV